MSGLAGTLGERVTILKRDPARDALGGASGGWLPAGTCWAGIVPNGAGADISGGAVAGLETWRVTLRAPSIAWPGDRIGWGGRRLAVRRRLADPRRPDRVTLWCEEER